MTIPARRSIFTAKRIFPFRDFVPNEELGQSPGWLPIDDTGRTFTSEFRRRGYWTAQVSDNPHLGFTKAFEPFRKSFDHWKSVVGQSGFYRSPETIPLEVVYDWLPPPLRDDRYVPGMRKYLANSGGGVNEEETCAARLFKQAADTLDDGTPAPAVLPDRRLLRSARALEPAAQVRRHVQGPELRGPEHRRDQVRLRAQLQRRRDSPPSRDLRGRGHDDRRLARPLHGPLLRARASTRTR